MKFRTILRHIKESFKSIMRNGWMTFASVSAVTVTLLLVGVFYIILMNLNEVATSIEKDVSIKVLIDSTTERQEQQVLEKQIKSLPEVGEIVYSSKEQELEQLITGFGEDGEILKLYDQRNPLNDAFIVKTKDPKDTLKAAKKIEKLDNVYRVRYGQGEVEKLFSIVDAGRTVGIVLIVGLLFTAIFLISNTIKITIVARRREIEIMRLVGATNGFIRWPFFLEGLWLGILGSIIPIAVIVTFYNKLYALIAPHIEGSFIRVLKFNPFAFQVSALLVLLGCLIGIWGSLMSVRKFLKI